MDWTAASGKTLLSGASGMLGSALRRALADREIPAVQLVRRSKPAEGQLVWNPDSEQPFENPVLLEGISAAVHLSGASVASHRWTDAYKQKMTSSRVDSTRRLATELAALRKPPKVLLVASAIGIYGDRGEDLLTESSSPGTGFLAEVCRQWEAAARPAVDAGIRVVNLRFGVVLGPGQGALQQMLPPFRFGLGARLGSGRQWMSWVSLADTVAAILFAMDRTELSGPLNVTAPNPVRNGEFTHALARQLHRPAVLAVPAFAMRIMFGQMADEALLASTRVEPAKLKAAGFQFSLPEIGHALRATLR